MKLMHIPHLHLPVIFHHFSKMFKPCLNQNITFDEWDQ